MSCQKLFNQTVSVDEVWLLDSCGLILQSKVGDPIFAKYNQLKVRLDLRVIFFYSEMPMDSISEGIKILPFSL